MRTETSVDPVPPVLDYLLGGDPGVDERIYGERFPDPLTLPAVCVQLIGATSEYIRIQVLVKVGSERGPGGGGGMIEAMEIWLEIDRLLNFCGAPICGLNSGFINREDGSPRTLREPNTDAAMVAAYYLLEMGG